MWEGILEKDYLTEAGDLLPRFKGKVWPWMYIGWKALPTDAASSPLVVMHNGVECRWRPETPLGGNVVAIEESFVPVKGAPVERRPRDVFSQYMKGES